MKQPTAFYKEQLDNYKKELSKTNAQISKLSVLRLLVFLSTAFGIYFFFNLWKIAIVIAVVGIVLFLVLLTKYTDIKRKQKLIKALIIVNEDELAIHEGNFENRNGGVEFQDPKHYYSLDIDLFGIGSFFQFINRTSIKESTLKLANTLKANKTTAIKLRQDAIQELSTKPKWRQKYQAIASLITIETSAEQIINWLNTYNVFVPKKMKWVSIVFSSISIAVFIAVYFNVIYPSFIFIWMSVGLTITGRYLKKVNDLSQSSDQIKDTFRQYALLLNEIENESFESVLLKVKQQKIQSDTEKASVIFSNFSKALDALDNRNNILLAVLGNGFFLLDIRNSHTIENWIMSYRSIVEHWFDVVTFFDAYNSLGNFTYNHPDYVFPEIKNDIHLLNTKNLGHPLLKKEKRVDNNIVIDKEQFFIVTGANMAGKSTFLRTVSFNIVMANIGLPVCATSCSYSPIKLITSMRTSDSLTDDSSYFFSELTRLKFIVDQIETTPYFIILDEILKGTNSTDKAIGSKKFVEKLVASNATGIIATHDLSLCEIENELSAIKNYYFDAEIINDELHFDYTFKKGICENMNASFLLKKMEII